MRVGVQVWSWTLSMVVALAGCGDNLPPPEEPATWYGEAGLIVRAKCAGCHQPDGIAPFSLYEYGDAYEQMGRMIEAIDDGIMPPWYANDPPDCTPRHPWRDDSRLTDQERDAIHAWVDGGGREGTKRELPGVRSTSLDGLTREIAPPQEFVTSGDRDQFMCILLDPRLARTHWVTGSQVYPTRPDLVHHVNVYLIDPTSAAETATAFGGIGVPHVPCEHPPGLAIQSWLPGNPALVLPADVGIPIVAGTLILLQVHYHPAGGGGPDATRVALRLTDVRPAWHYELGVYGNSPGKPNLQPGPGDPGPDPVFMVPAGAADHVETMIMQHRADLVRELRILSVTPHMHMLGTHERVTVTHADGDTECLIDSGWSFDWQRTYTYDAEIADLPLFDASSKVNLSCHWNNSFSNPELPRLLHDTNMVAPYDVYLGLTTRDEMCLADFGVLTPN